MHVVSNRMQWEAIVFYEALKGVLPFWPEGERATLAHVGASVRAFFDAARLR